MDDETETLGHYRTLHAANMKAVEHIMESGIYSPRDEGDAIFDLDANGGIRFENNTDGSMGGRVTLYIKRRGMDG